MSLLFESLGFGIAVAFIILGIIGTIIPIIPGTLLVWLTVVIFAIATDFATLGFGSLAIVTLIALVTGTSDWWLPLLGAKKTGAAPLSMILGTIAAIVGTFMLPLIGTVIGYALGIWLGEFIRHRDVQLSLKASAGGVAGWGIATAVQLGGAILIAIVFFWQSLAG